MSDLARELLTEVKSSLESKRRKESEERINIYKDAWTDILKSEIDQQFNEKTRDNVKQMLALDVNVLKRIVKEISIVYLQSAKRSYIHGEGETLEEDKRYRELMDQIPVNLTMQEINRYTNLCNESLIYIVPRNNRIEYDILTPDLVEVVQSKTNAKEVEAIIFTQTFVDTKGDTSIYYIYWDIFGQHLKFDENMDPVKIEGNEKGVNPYNDPNNPGQTILPFVIFHKEMPVDSVFNVTGGGDVVSGTKQVGVLLTYINYLFKVQSFKQKVFKGVNVDDIPANLVSDPLFNLVVSGENGDVALLDYQILIDKLWDLVFSKIGAIANNYGMSLDNFKIIGSAQSGYALRIKNLGIEKIVTEQIKLYRWGEKELFEKTQIINNDQYKEQIKLGGVFKIDFAEQIYPESPEDIRLQWEFNIKLGAKSLADYAMFVNPDIKDVEEATKLINANVGINKIIESTTGISMELIEKAFADNGPEASNANNK